MGESAHTAATAAILTVFLALSGCRDRETIGGGSIPAVALAGETVAACARDSLRPATAAPAPGLWLYQRESGERIAAMIGPQRTDDGTLAVRRSVETVEVSAAGDTLRHAAVAATVSLELLPPLGDSAPADSAAGQHPAATYAVSPRVRLAAYEPCATSRRGPRIRYLRRDAAGRIVTDVLLERTSEQ